MQQNQTRTWTERLFHFNWSGNVIIRVTGLVLKRLFTLILDIIHCSFSRFRDNAINQLFPPLPPPSLSPFTFLPPLSLPLHLLLQLITKRWNFLNIVFVRCCFGVRWFPDRLRISNFTDDEVHPTQRV